MRYTLLLMYEYLSFNPLLSLLFYSLMRVYVESVLLSRQREFVNLFHSTLKLFNSRISLFLLVYIFINKGIPLIHYSHHLL